MTKFPFAASAVRNTRWLRLKMRSKTADQSSSSLLSSNKSDDSSAIKIKKIEANKENRRLKRKQNELDRLRTELFIQANKFILVQFILGQFYGSLGHFYGLKQNL